MIAALPFDGCLHYQSAENWQGASMDRGLLSTPSRRGGGARTGSIHANLIGFTHRAEYFYSLVLVLSKYKYLNHRFIN
jgi:hypothetical protein